jgi:hypothetical protein
LLLREEKPCIVSVNSNAKEMMEIAKIRHRKFRGEGSNNGPEKSSGIGCEDDIIHIQKKIGSV